MYALLVILFVGLILMTAYMGVQSNIQAKKRIADAQANLDTIQASTDTPQVKARKAIELELSDHDVELGLDANNPGNMLRDRLLAYTRLGYQAADPLPSQTFLYQSDVDCVRKATRY
jgi:hypothetical protein